MPKFAKILVQSWSKMGSKQTQNRNRKMRHQSRDFAEILVQNSPKKDPKSVQKSQNEPSILRTAKNIVFCQIFKLRKFLCISEKAPPRKLIIAGL